MPTCAVSTAKDTAPDQRRRTVESITAIHSVEATAPRYFVQVIFNKVEPGSIVDGGGQASPDHVWVRAAIRAGRTREKAGMLRRIMHETSAILAASEQDGRVSISDIPAVGVPEFGNGLPALGEEEQWLASLPGDPREKLMRAA